jgi:hypothetical protein
LGRARLGDVFLVPIDESRVGIGQIAGDWNGELYIVIYDAVQQSSKAEPVSGIGAPPLFAALSLDAKIYNGDWPVVANITDNLDQLPQPAFKVNVDGEVFVESRDRTATRRASATEAEALRFRTVVAPVRLEKALKAHHGIGEWDPKYDDLLAEYASQSARLIAD